MDLSTPKVHVMRKIDFVVLGSFLFFAPSVLLFGRTLDDSSALQASSAVRAKVGMGLPIRVLFIGDSMSDVGYNYVSISHALAIKMRNKYGDGGQGLDGLDLNSEPAVFNRPTPVGFFFGVSAALYPGDRIFSVQGGTNYYLDHSGWLPEHLYNRAGVFWYSHPWGGLFKIGITNLWTRAPEIAETQLNGFSLEPEIHYTNWPVSPVGHLGLWATGVTATNFLIGPEMANTNRGVEVFFFSRGGTGLTQWLSLGTNLLGQLWSEVAPDLVVYHAKDYGPPPDLPPDREIISSNFTTFISTLTNVTQNIVVVGTPPTGSIDGSNQIQNLVEKAVADANSFGFVDLNAEFSNFVINRDGGLMFDETHPSAFGASVLSDEMARQLGFDAVISAVPRPLIRDSSESDGKIYLVWGTTVGHTYQVQTKSDASMPWSDLGDSVTATSHTASMLLQNGSGTQFYRILVIR